MREILVPVSFGWRIAGSIFGLGALFTFGCAVYFLWTDTAIDHLSQFIFILNLLFAPMIIAFLMPCFVQRYPDWVVGIFGRDYLLRLVEQCRQELGGNRFEKITVSKPSSWIRGRRWIWLLVMGSAMVLGVIYSINN
jgi:hypothetical protein